MLGDAQLVTGLAIIIASLVNMIKDDETPLYHIFVARGLADVSLAGHSATSVLIYPRRDHTWPFLMRLGLIAATVVLWEYWSWLALERFDRWDWVTPHCLENNNRVPGDYDDWIAFSLVWMPIGYSTLLLNVWDDGRYIVDRFEDAVTGGPGVALERFTDFFDSLDFSGGTSHFLASLQKLMIAIATTVIVAIFLAFAVIMPASRVLMLPQSIISFPWDAYDVYIAREANAHIIVVNPKYRPGKSFQNNDNPEHDWGFGQILPLVMLLLPILATFDAISGELTVTDCELRL